MPIAQPISGLLNIDKPPGLTSHDVVAQIRRLLNTSTPSLQNRHRRHDQISNASPKVGHTGTLDPFATGILLIAIGSATRLIEYSHTWEKTYQTVFILGASSDTDDATGQISKTTYPKPKMSIEPTRTQIQAALHQFIGPIKQVPPAFSAVKIAGERAYKIARQANLSGRQGSNPTLQPRSIIIHSLQITHYAHPKLSLAITCSTGTYLRSLARDLGTVLSTGAYVQELCRTQIGPHKLTQSIKLKNLTTKQLKERLLPATALIFHLPQITLPDDNVAQFIQGQTIGEQGTTMNHTNNTLSLRSIDLPSPTYQTSQDDNSTTFAIFNQSSTLIGIAKLDPLTHLLHPVKVLIT
ncbi:MAG TPA: tRNA pseudouridine(55) synthase TruB [Candidatus Andersenbacteria bacterium]|nr:MAG: tRNA pseudouridine synthase B [Parcubacteria group bacterium GW2011_GWA2_45_14]OGY35102.1 MAG: tRNA pseudouridine(55) synthase TruB [Candidatus Andersenbacteria bacterium RIFCSPHIGHO2_02_FULL_46_16]HBE90447.1 tRNA pseudouridine(55) synthase TruB [Candidatus Andersenbacteria bacterium]